MSLLYEMEICSYIYEVKNLKFDNYNPYFFDMPYWMV